MKYSMLYHSKVSMHNKHLYHAIQNTVNQDTGKSLSAWWQIAELLKLSENLVDWYFLGLFNN